MVPWKTPKHEKWESIFQSEIFEHTGKVGGFYAKSGMSRNFKLNTGWKVREFGQLKKKSDF